MHWNYRICKQTYDKETKHAEVLFSLREAYYNDSGELNAVTENSVGLHGETLEDLQDGFEKMKLAFNKPVIDVDTQVFVGFDDDDVDSDIFDGLPE